jgi:hypothetical protein
VTIVGSETVVGSVIAVCDLEVERASPEEQVLFRLPEMMIDQVAELMAQR